MKQISRRQFLKGAALAAAGATLAACTPAATTAPTTAPVTQSTATTAPAAKPTVVNVVGTLPRTETLYIEGQQWSAVKGWNPYSADMNNALACSQQDNSRCLVFETPYMYNMLDGKLYPLLADGDFTWDANRTQITYKIKKAAHWSDGTPVTADDAAYSWATFLKYETQAGALFKDYIDTVVAADPQTVVVKMKLGADGKAVNPILAGSFVSWAFVNQKAFTQKLEARVGGDATKFKADPAEDFVWSGPYTKSFADNSKVIYVRDDKYWGQDASMWGKLPVPKYLAHVIYKDNAAGVLADKAGEVDVSQEFIANVQELWLKDNLPASTYLQNAPYTICAQIPTAWFNMKSYGLDQVAIRKAIAMAVDYDTIIANAMTNQSPTFKDVPRSVMNPTQGEQAMYDHAAVADLQWVGKDIEGAKKLLDDAGIKVGASGFREYNGKKLTYNACCPQGWSDWQASMEIVAAAGKNIGIDITTNYPDWGVYQTVFTNGEQTDYDIFMWSGLGATPTCPWARVRQLMSSEYVGTKGNWNGNYGGYSNPAADQLIAAIPAETDPAKLKDLYTQAVKLYLTEVPSFALMYRPQAFQTVFEWVWTGFPTADDGKNIPPLDLMDGYAIAGLYNLTLLNE